MLVIFRCYHNKVALNVGVDDFTGQVCDSLRGADREDFLRFVGLFVKPIFSYISDNGRGL